MALSLAKSAQLSTAACSRVATRAVAVRPVTIAAPRPSLRAARKTAAPAGKVATKVAPVEIAQLAGEAEFIGGVALTMFAITLVGMAVGFVILRVEGLVEEGKL